MRDAPAKAERSSKPFCSTDVIFGCNVGAFWLDTHVCVDAYTLERASVSAHALAAQVEIGSTRRDH